MFDYFPLQRILICQIDKGKRLLLDILLFLKRSQQQHNAFQFLKGSAGMSQLMMAIYLDLYPP